MTHKVEEGEAKYEFPAKVYFSLTDLENYRNRPINSKSERTIEEIPEALSPYLRAAMSLSKKYKLTEDSELTLDNLQEMLSDDWPAECGQQSAFKTRNLAKFMRWPSQEKGGNRSQK